MINLLKKSAAGVMAVALLGLSLACSHREVHQVGSHKVTVSRHGLKKTLDVNKTEATLNYAGVGTTGEMLSVFIIGDKVRVNGLEGMLRPGDSVFIGDDGVAVNSLDYGESEKYLQANNPETSTVTVTATVNN